MLASGQAAAGSLGRSRQQIRICFVVLDELGEIIDAEAREGGVQSEHIGPAQIGRTSRCAFGGKVITGPKRIGSEGVQ